MNSQMALQRYRDDYVFIQATAEQVRKDFDPYFPAMIFSEKNKENAFQELFDQLRPVVDGLYGRNPAALQNILYRVDIPDNDLREIYGAPAGAMIDVLTAAVLQRELFKVVCRHLYGNQT